LLLPTLSQCVALTHLDLSDNNVTAEGVEALITTLLQPDSRLRDLRLANNWLGPVGVCALAGPLAANVGLQYLDVSNTSARPADALRLDSDRRALQSLADALKVSLLLDFDTYP
jgi:Ran GTPase-activating protein (RanGAP) involved in mRNA processing and transport